MRFILVLMLFAIPAFAGSVFVENEDLWIEIDRINEILGGTDHLDSSTLEALFQETVEVALSPQLQSQFEDLREDAFETENFDEIDSYADRAGLSINVFIMGESNNIGVNVPAFLDLSIADTEAYTFFLVSVGGFYAGSEISRSGTAELPAWMERTESSAQAEVAPEKAEEWLGYWRTIRPSLNGYFLGIADVTIQELAAGIQ